MKYLIAIISILLGSFAQYFLKVGVSGLNSDRLSSSIMGTIFSNIYFWLGCASYGLSLLFWLYVLSKMELSKAYPMVSLGYVFAMILGYVFLHESINFAKIVGICLIIAGVIFISRG